MKRIYVFLFCVSLLILFPAISFSQTATASVEGKVTDKEKLLIPGASVTARNVETGFTRSSVTSESGHYNIFAIPPGKYEIKVEHPVYGPQARTIDLVIGQRATISFILELKEIQEEVVVTAAAPGLELKKSELSIPIRTEYISSLPLNTRNFVELATLAPGIKTWGGTVASGAGLPTNIGFYIDGAQYKNEIVEGGMVGQFVSTGNIFPLDALREFRVITQGYKAEYAKAGYGAITAASKTGTNEFRGTAFTTYRDKALNEKGYFETVKPDYERYQGGVSLGGPIIKDKLHFFLSYEGESRASFATVVPGRDIFKDYAGTFRIPFTQHLGLVRLTFQPNPKHYFDFSWHGKYDKSLIGIGGIASRERGRDFLNHVYTGILKHQFIISPTMMNEVRLNFQRYNWEIACIVPWGTPGKLYPSIQLGGFSHAPQNWFQDRYALYDDLSYSWGDHNFKAGIYIERLRYKATQMLFGNPQFYFRTDTDTIPWQAIVGAGTPEVEKYNTQLGLYIQDDWNVSRYLTLNLGLRWDYESNMINSDFAIPENIRKDLSPYFDSKYFSDGTNRKPYLYAFAPRLGFSYDLTKKDSTFLFGGFGVYYDRHVWNVASDEILRLTWKVYYMYFTAMGTPGTIKWDEKYYNRDEVLKLVALGKTDPPEIFLIPNDLKPPKTYQFSLGIRQLITQDMSVSLSYTNVLGCNEITTYDANYRDANLLRRVLTTSYGRINVWTDEGNSWYDGIYFTLDKAYKPGSWGLQFAYTLSWAKDEFDNNIYYGYLYYSKPEQLKKADSTLDERHKISINCIVDLPLKFQFSAWSAFSTGRPYLVFTGSDDNFDSLMGNDYPPGEGRNARRVPNNTFIFKNIFSSRVVNARLAKFFTFSRYRIMLMVDAFNVFNQVNFGGYIGNMKSAKFVQPTTAGAPRQVQLSLRFNF